MMAFMIGAALAASHPAMVGAGEGCSDLLNIQGDRIEQGARATVEDLVGLRDLGGQTNDGPPFSISPDGTRLAVLLRQANARANDYCQAILILETGSGHVSSSRPVVGGVILNRYDLPTIADFGGGVISTLVPRWSPDSKWLAYLERHDGVVQVVRVAAAGGEALAVTHSNVDVRSFDWSLDGTEIHYLARPGEITAAAALRNEGQRGFRFDKRWMPEWQSSPFAPPSPIRKFAVSIATALVRELPAVEPQSELDSIAKDRSGNAARITSQGAGLLNGPKQIVVSTRTGLQRTCRDRPCANAVGFWWARGDQAIVASRGGWNRGTTELFSWNVRTNRMRRILSTADHLDGCEAAPAGLVCAIEGAKTPRRLVVIDYRTGTQRILFDPNPEWQSLDLGKVRRLYWRNNLGLEAYGDLVLPPGNNPPSKLPLIVVGYRSRGFLRGGTGDMFPIYPLAARGFAVLVYERPPSIGYLEPVDNQAEADRRDYEGWADKKSGASSIMTAIAMLVEQGIVDPARIGLTGFSDGVDKATYTLINNDAFAAVSLAACCSDPMAINGTIGPYLSDVALAMGYPAYKDRVSERVRQYSVAANAEKLRTPILIQTADREFLRSLEVEAAFRQAGRPLSLYVFPDEYHVFWQPAHRKAAYQRNLDWFDYQLLRGGEGELPDMLKPTSTGH